MRASSPRSGLRKDSPALQGRVLDQKFCPPSPAPVGAGLEMQATEQNSHKDTQTMQTI